VSPPESQPVRHRPQEVHHPPVVFREFEIDPEVWSCSTSLDGFNENVVFVDCGHAFHRLCVERDVASRSLNGFLPCPVCRQHLRMPLSLVPAELEVAELENISPARPASSEQLLPPAPRDSRPASFYEQRSARG